MKLTCVTAVYNAIRSGNRERLIRCVESVARLKIEHEHLIYDGASSDGTLALLREMEAKIKGLKVVSEPDTGIYNALNKGVRDAKGEWFYVLGADDYILHPDVMECTIAENGDEIDMSVSTVDRDDGTKYFTSLKSLAGFFTVNCYSHQGVLLRTKWMRYFGGFAEDNPISSDYDLFLKIHKSALAIRYSFDSFACYAIGGASANQEVNERFDIPIFCRHLNVTREEAANRWERPFPIRRMLPFVFHKDLMLRMASRRMIRWKIFRIMRILFYPIIVIEHMLSNRLYGHSRRI